ncbi:MAG: M56 family metallopeptidase [Oscillospiraceae bacterium]|nr:M56 family metallopeptidase [Oscillospiraceae bacterium]
MDKLFLAIFNMSLTGAFVIAAICVARLPLKKAPKIISYFLWAVAGFRLLFPFSIESVFSLIPFKAQTIPPDIAMQPIPRIDSGIPFVNNAVSSVLPAATPAASVNPLQIWTAIGAWIWIIGVAVMLIYGVVSFVTLKRKMSEAAHSEANIYEAKNIKSPFVLGVFNPKIYLPVGLSEHEKSYIILHEQTYIRRRDHIVKFAAYFVLCLHWFNPFAWVAFLLMGVDMEMSCDERVLKEMGGETKKDYSLSLLSLATERRIIGGSPLAFGEGGIKERVKNVLKFKKTSRVIMITAVALVAVLSAGFAVNRASAPNEPPEITVKAGDYAIDWTVGLNKWNGDIYDRLDNFTEIMSHYRSTSNLPYIRNGETITITIDGIVPDSTTVTEYILNESGNRKYNAIGMSYDVHFSFWNNVFSRAINRSASFTITPEPNYATALSSFSGDYEPGNTIKGYGILCTWGDNECEYGFIIRGDAAITMTHEPNGENPNDDNFIVESTFAPCKWVDFFGDDELSWTSTCDLMLDEFPGVLFSWTSYTVTATNQNGTEKLFGGMPVWNVYLADLNGDGLRELCATVSFGSGIVDTRVVIYDYANGKSYELSARGIRDYRLSIENERLIVTENDNPARNSIAPPAVGSFAIINGEFVYTVERILTFPKSQEVITRETTPPSDVAVVADIIQRNLDTITAPSFSSNPYDYVRDHKSEYNEIVALGGDALQYMFTLFDKSNQHGLQGWIMAIACCDILGESTEFASADIDTGQKWYDAYVERLHSVKAPRE